MKITKVNAIAQVQSSISSIFSKEDVLFLINSIEEKSKGITEQQIEKVIENVMNNLERNTEEVVDYTSVEFNISYDNRLEVESVGVNFDYIREALENNLCELFEEEVVED